MLHVNGLSNLPLVRRKPTVPSAEERAMEAVGGYYEAVHPVGLKAEIRRLGIRALAS